MATYYIWNGATGANNGTSWANAFTDSAAAVAGKAAGDVFFLAHDHVESKAVTFNWLGVGTEANPCALYCVNRLGSVPPIEADLRTTAQMTTTNNAGITITGAWKEIYGVIISCGAALTITNLPTRLVNCQLKLTGTSATQWINLGAGGNIVVLDGCTVQFNEATGQGLRTAGRCIIKNSPGLFLTGSIIPTGLFTTNNTLAQFCEGLDLSNINTALLKGGQTVMNNFTFKDCKLNAAVVMSSQAYFAAGTFDCVYIRCDSGDTNYRTERHNYMGVQTTDATTYLMGGASDGTNSFSMKVVTSANTLGAPFECLPINIWNDTVGVAKTVTLQGQWANGAVPTNANIWMDVHYLGTSGFPLGLKATSGKPSSSTLGAGTNLAAGAGTWVNPQATQFAMSATFTPQEKGPLTIYVKSAIPSSTFWINPKPVIV